MSQEWYYSVDGDRQGPVGGAELKKLAEAGTLKPTDLVWKDGMPDWVQARSIKGLFGASGTAGGAAAPAPAPAAKPAAQPAARPRPAADEDDDDRPARARRRDEDDDEDDRPSRRRRDDEDDEEDRPARSARRREDEDEEDDRPVRRRDDDDEDEDDRPRKRRGGRIPEDIASKKMTAGLLGILLGGFAVHKFYLGFTGTAVIQLLISLFTCGMVGFLGLIEGIIYLTKSDEDFYQTYIVEQKQWF